RRRRREPDAAGGGAPAPDRRAHRPGQPDAGRLEAATRAVRRYAAARCGRPRARDAAQAPSNGRAVQRPRRPHARHAAGRALAKLGRAANDGDADHQRRRRGDPAGRPDLPDDARAGRGPGAGDRGRSAAPAPAAAHEPRARLSEGETSPRRVSARRTEPARSYRTMSSYVEIAQLGKTYETPTGPAVIVRDFTLYVDEGEFDCLLGHSGCGKTTVLSILMGLTTPSTGGVVIGGREIDGPGTDRGVVFQSATLLPWMS